MRLMLSIICAAGMVAIVGSGPASSQQTNQSDLDFAQQRAVKKPSGNTKWGDVTLKRGNTSGKRVGEGGQNTSTHKLPSRSKAQKNPDTLGRVKTQFPW